MGKHEFLTPKAIANRDKAKGPQKLRWYCEMCMKQCRDQNGFNCHCLSEGHLNQMQIFGEIPNLIIKDYSEDFENFFLAHLKSCLWFSRMAATVVCNEYITEDKDHVHMNSTRWLTLTEFVKYLGQTSKYKVEETPKGWFITYINRDCETLFKERVKRKRIKTTMAEEEKQEEEKEEKVNRKDYWLYEGLVVKVMSKALADKGHYKQKGVVLKVIDKYVGEIEMLESNNVLRVDQAELETVIPRIGGLVKIVNGAYRGSIARLLGVDTDGFCTKVQIEKGPLMGESSRQWSTRIHAK